MSGIEKQLAEALRKLLNRDERNTCSHEETHRGGAIWEICNSCGARWADDEGGKPEWQDPPEWNAAREALAAFDAAPAPEADELEKSYEARRQAQAEAAAIKGDILKIEGALLRAGIRVEREGDGYKVSSIWQDTPSQAQQAEPVAALRGLIDALDAKDIERAHVAMGRARVVLAGIGASSGEATNG